MLLNGQRGRMTRRTEGMTDAVMGTQSEAELVSQSRLPFHSPFISEKSSSSRIGAAEKNEQLAAKPPHLFFVPGEKRTHCEEQRLNK